MKYEIIVYTPAGYAIEQRYYNDRAKAKDFYHTCLAKYLDYEVEFNTMQS